MYFTHSGLSTSRLSRYIILVFVLLVNTALVEGCYPSRSQGRGNYRIQRSTPFVIKQHFPNAPELSNAASGPPEGRITRKSKRYRTNLLTNYNKDIVFKNEEGTWEDRLMSRRCLESLDTLAMLVTNYWPGIKLRVTEAWDEKGFHAPNSLHYEGRAVDITTSDKDRSKYGMLARLAVRAGFDYVYYESRAHIHASVKSDTAESPRLRGCFSLSTKVVKCDGTSIELHRLKHGDTILSDISDKGKPIFSPVIAFIHTSRTQPNVEMVEVATTNGQRVRMTPNHLVYKYYPNCPTPPEQINVESMNSECLAVAQAEELTLSDLLVVITENRGIKSGKIRQYDGTNSSTPLEIQISEEIMMKNLTRLGLEPAISQLRLARIDSIRRVNETGYMAPLTMSGNIVADGVKASCYASFYSQTIAHASFAPYRAWVTLRGFVEQLLSSLRDKFDSVLAQVLNILKTKVFNVHNNGTTEVLSRQSDIGDVDDSDHLHWYARLLLWTANSVMGWGVG